MSEFKQHIKSVLEKYELNKEKISLIIFEVLDEFSGEDVYIPIPYQERNEAIVTQAKNGISTKKIAHEFGLTVRSIEKIIKNYNQGDK